MTERACISSAVQVRGCGPRSWAAAPDVAGRVLLPRHVLLNRIAAVDGQCAGGNGRRAEVRPPLRPPVGLNPFRAVVA
jgi:hypothetical protein